MYVWKPTQTEHVLRRQHFIALLQCGIMVRMTWDVSFRKYLRFPRRRHDTIALFVHTSQTLLMTSDSQVSSGSFPSALNMFKVWKIESLYTLHICLYRKKRLSTNSALKIFALFHLNYGSISISFSCTWKCPQPLPGFMSYKWLHREKILNVKLYALFS